MWKIKIFPIWTCLHECKHIHIVIFLIFHECNIFKLVLSWCYWKNIKDMIWNEMPSIFSQRSLFLAVHPTILKFKLSCLFSTSSLTVYYHQTGYFIVDRISFKIISLAFHPKISSRNCHYNAGLNSNTKDHSGNHL